MNVVYTKPLRQRLVQTAALAKIDREHLSVDTEKAHRSQRTTRANFSGSPLMTVYLDRRENCSTTTTLTIAGVSRSDIGTSVQVRNLSPLSASLSERSAPECTRRPATSAAE